MENGNGCARREKFKRDALPYFSYLLTSAFYLTGDKVEAEDLVQETYLRAFRFFHKFQPGTNCRAWLLSIERHLFINRYWQKKREPEMFDWEKVEQAESVVEQGRKTGPASLLFSKLMKSDIESTIDMENALKELSEELRTAIRLVDVEELTYEEAAQVMGCPIGTIRSRVSRGRRILQVRLTDYAVEMGIIDKNARIACRVRAHAA